MFYKNLLIYFIITFLLPLPQYAQDIITYENPVFADYKSHDLSLIQGDDGRFYAFGTCVVARDSMKHIPYYGVSIFVSDDLVNWEYLKQAYSNEYMRKLYIPSRLNSKRKRNMYFIEQGDTIGYYRVWAPDIIKYKDRYLLFVALRNSFDDSKIAVFEASSITDEFEFKNIVVSTSKKDNEAYVNSRETIDPFPIIDDNKLYLVFGSFARNGQGKMYEHRRGIGTYIVPIIHRDDKYKMESTPIFLTDYYEGNCIVKRNNTYFLFGTNGALTNHTYKISYAVSNRLTGPYLNSYGKSIADTININLGSIILQTTNSKFRYNGFGCMSTPIINKDGRYFVLVNGHDMNRPPIIEKKSSRERYGNLIELHWNEAGKPYFNIEEIERNTTIRPNF